MVRERPGWFWAITSFFVIAWALAGTVSIFYIINDSIYVGEAVIIISTLVLTMVYYLVDRYINY